MANPTNKPEKRVFVRRHGRPLRSTRADVIEHLLPKLSLDKDTLQEDGMLSPARLFPDYKEFWFEVGFGTGEHLSGLMRRHPDHAYIGAEPYVNGMSAFLKDIKDEPHDRIKVHMDDAMMVAHSLEDECLDGIYVLNPDPWHKKRHHKRRMVRRETLGVFARILKPGAQFVCSTDVPDLADWMITEVMLHGGFEWQARSANDWRTPPEDWIHTAYEGKRAKGADKMVYLFFRKKT